MAKNDKTAPKLISVNPKKGDSAIALNKSITFMFNEDIQAGLGNIVLSNGADTRKIPLTPTQSASSQFTITGKLLTLNLAEKLLPNSLYSVKIENTAIEDLSGNKYAGINNATMYYFNTIDTLEPILTTSSSTANASNFAVNSNIVLTFNEKIQAGIGNITLKSNTDLRTISIMDNQVKISGNTLTLNPTIDLNTNSTYKLTISAGAIKDLASVANSTAAMDFSFTTKATGDKQAPALQNYTEKGIVSDNLTLNFQEAIKVGIGSFTLSDGIKNISIPVTDASQVSIANNVLIINPTENLNPEKIYTVIAPKGIVTDLAKNAFVGLTTKTPFTFDTHDTTPPALTMTDDKTTTSNSAIFYTFTPSEAIKDFTIDDIIITGGVKGEFTSVAGSNNYTLSVTPAINSTTPITVDVPVGKFTDIVGNSNLVSVTHTQAVDTVSPIIAISDDIIGITNSPMRFTLTPSEAIKDFTIDDIIITGGVKGEFTSVAGTNNYTLSVTPEVNSTTPITVDVPAGKFTDIVGNSNLVSVTNTQAVDTVSPIIIISDDKSTLTNSAILYTFTSSNPIKDFTIDDVLVNGGSKGEFTSVTGTNNFTLSVIPNANSIESITIDVAEGAFTDLAGNKNVAVAQNSQSVDTRHPLLQGSTPADDSSYFSNTGNIILIFDENIFTGSGSFVISNGSDTQTIPVNDDKQVVINNNIVTLNPARDLITNSNYHLTFAPGVLTDKVGNNFAGLTISTQLNFNTDLILTTLKDTASQAQVITDKLNAKALDGYLKNATVFVDENEDGIQNANEATAITDDYGNFEIVKVKGTIVVSGGTDLSTGNPFEGTLKAPEGSTVVTPLTTMMQGFIEAKQTPTEAQKSVAEAFGFDSTIDLTSYDPIAGMVNSDNTPSTQAKATQIMSSSAQIANFLVTAGRVLQGAAGDNGNVTTQNASDSLIKSLVNSVKTANGVINLSDSTLLKTVLVDGAKEVNKQAQKSGLPPKFDPANFTDKIDKMADTVAVVLKGAADNIIDAVNKSNAADPLTLLTNMDKISKFAQNEAGKSLQQIAVALDIKDDVASKKVLQNQVNLLTGLPAAQAIEKNVVQTVKSVPDILAADKAIKNAPPPPVTNNPGSPDMNNPGAPVGNNPNTPVTTNPGVPATNNPGAPVTNISGSPDMNNPGAPVGNNPNILVTTNPGVPGTNIPGVPATNNPGAPATNNSDAPVPNNPDAPAPNNPGAPDMNNPGAPVGNNPNTPVTTNPGVPGTNIPGAPVINNSEIPVGNNPGAPVTNNLGSPDMNNPGAPVGNNPGAPVTNNLGSPDMNNPGAPVGNNPGAPVTNNLGSPDMNNPGAPVGNNPGAPVTNNLGSPDMNNPGAPVGNNPGAPVTNNPDAPATNNPGAPVTNNPDAPATNNPGAPATNNPDAPVPNNPGAPATNNPDAPATNNPDVPVPNNPDAPATNNPGAQAPNNPGTLSSGNSSVPSIQTTFVELNDTHSPIILVGIN